MAHGALMDECMIFLTRQTSVCGEPVTVHTVDEMRWFSSKKDIRLFEARRAKVEKLLGVKPLRTGVTLGRFTYYDSSPRSITARPISNDSRIIDDAVNPSRAAITLFRISTIRM